MKLNCLKKTEDKEKIPFHYAGIHKNILKIVENARRKENEKVLEEITDCKKDSQNENKDKETELKIELEKEKEKEALRASEGNNDTRPNNKAKNYSVKRRKKTLDFKHISYIRKKAVNASDIHIKEDEEVENKDKLDYREQLMMIRDKFAKDDELDNKKDEDKVIDLFSTNRIDNNEPISKAESLPKIESISKSKICNIKDETQITKSHSSNLENDFINTEFIENIDNDGLIIEENQEPAMLEENYGIVDQAEEGDGYTGNRVTIDTVSKIAYLIGVDDYIFFERKDYNLEIFEQLNKDKNARIIRNLSILRNVLFQHHQRIAEKIKYEYKTLTQIPEYIKPDIIYSLENDGVRINRNNNRYLINYTKIANREIQSRIGNLKSLFPEWIIFDYIKNLFLVPNGQDEEAINEAEAIYNYNRAFYPFKCYINWDPRDCGNVLYDDRKFLNLLYTWNNDIFRHEDKLILCGVETKEKIYDFINNSEKLDLIVDCENSNAFKLAATIRALNDELNGKVNKIILIDDVHTLKAWKHFDRLVKGINIEHIIMERVAENKSLVDIGFAAKLCKEAYKENINSFIICSSDSDMWGITKIVNEADYMILAERRKFGREIKDRLKEENIMYAYIEDFYAESCTSEDFVTSTVLMEIKEMVEERLKAFNLKDELEKIFNDFYIEVTDVQRSQFYRNHLKNSKILVNEEGNFEFNYVR